MENEVDTLPLYRIVILNVAETHSKILEHLHKSVLATTNAIGRTWIAKRHAIMREQRNWEVHIISN